DAQAISPSTNTPEMIAAIKGCSMDDVRAHNAGRSKQWGAPPSPAQKPNSDPYAIANRPGPVLDQKELSTRRAMDGIVDAQDRIDRARAAAERKALGFDK